MVVQSWADILVGSFQTWWNVFVNFLPNFLGALIVFLVGLIIAAGLAALVAKIIAAIKLDKLLEKVGVGKFCQKAGWNLNSAKFLGEVVRWFFILVFLLAATDILKLQAISGFLKDVLLYLPNIIIAIVIILAAVVIGDFLAGLVRGTVKGANLYASKFSSSLTRWVVLIFGFLTALIQLGVGVAIINTVITGIIAMLAIAGGIAFGLGGKEYAQHLIERFREKVEER
jgi:small-conductance mechanosensitive channel